MRFEHQERGLSLTKITEQYQRFAKSLIAVGDAGSASMAKDRHLGLAIELVAEVNPYQTPPPKIMPIRLLLLASRWQMRKSLFSLA